MKPESFESIKKSMEGALKELKMSNEYKDWQADEITELKQKYELLQFDYHKLKQLVDRVETDYNDCVDSDELLDWFIQQYEELNNGKS